MSGRGKDETGRDGAAWLAAVEAALATPEEHVVHPEHDLGGHELALLDFDPATLERLRRIGRLLEIPESPGVRSALAISGSAAQTRVHPVPDDTDYFERLHLQAPDRQTAQARFARLVRANALTTGAHPALRLTEVLFGRLPVPPGGPLRWSPAEVDAARLTRPTAEGDLTMTWAEAAVDPGFVKLDWRLVDPSLDGPLRVSKVIDGTWESPAGEIVSLDGLIDGDFQQIYLAADDAMLAARLVHHAAPDLGRAFYVACMDQEIVKHLRQEPPDFVKIAKRLYNRCRLTGHYREALWLRELFDDEPAHWSRARARLDQLAVAGARPAEAVATLHALLADAALAEAVGAVDPAALARCRQLAGEVDAAAIAVAITALDQAFARLATRAVEERLREEPAVAQLLATIAATASLAQGSIPL